MSKLETNQLTAKALRIASSAHQGEVRKSKEIPYIVHPVEAAMVLQRNGQSDKLIAACLLHDTLENTDINKEQLEEEFGSEIKELVIGASEQLEVREEKDWEDRKEHTINYLKTAPREVKYLSCADKLSNVRSMIRDYEHIGDEFWNRFNRGYEDQKWYYNGLVDSLDELEGEEIYEQFVLAVNYLF